jgi:hypothetical protein
MKFEEGSGDQCGVRQKKDCDTRMSANWLTLNRTSTVQMVRYCTAGIARLP